MDSKKKMTFLTGTDIYSSQKKSRTGKMSELKIKEQVPGWFDSPCPISSSRSEKLNLENEYYNKLEIGPGFKFYQALCNLKRPIKNYGLRIPSSYICKMQTLLEFNPKKGILTSATPMPRSQFQDSLLTELHIMIEKRKNILTMDSPAYIERKANFHNKFYYEEIINWKTIKEKAGSIEFPVCFFQQFIGQDRHFEMIYRYTHIYSQPKTRKASYVEIFRKDFLPNGKVDYTLIGKSFTALNEFEAISKKIAFLLNQEYGYRLFELALDFIKDPKSEPKYYLVDLHRFELDPASLRKVLSPRGSVFTDKALSPVKCSLCGEKYKTHEVEKHLPIKMLIEMKNHMKKRRIYHLFLPNKGKQFYHLFPELRGVAEQFLMHSCRVCNLCYHLIVQEHILIEVERRMALVQGIPAQEESRKTIKELLFQPVLIKERMIQWRILLYPQKFFGLSAVWLSENNPRVLAISAFRQNETLMQFNKQNSLTKKISQSNIESEIYTTTDTVVIVQLGQIIHKTNYSNFYCINQMRILYFFSECEDISEFLQTFQVNMALQNRKNENIAESSSLMFSDFALYSPLTLKADKHRKLIHFYGSSLNLFKLDMLTGLCYDGEIDIQGTTLTKVSNSRVYFPDNEYYNSFPLPEEWMETFRDGKYRIEPENCDNIQYDSSINIHKLILPKTLNSQTSRARSQKSTITSNIELNSETPMTLFTHNRRSVPELSQCLDLPKPKDSSLRAINSPPACKKSHKNQRCTSAIPKEPRVTYIKTNLRFKDYSKMLKKLERMKSPYGNNFDVIHKMKVNKDKIFSNKRNSMPNPLNNDSQNG